MLKYHPTILDSHDYIKQVIFHHIPFLPLCTVDPSSVQWPLSPPEVGWWLKTEGFVSFLVNTTQSASPTCMYNQLRRERVIDINRQPSYVGFSSCRDDNSEIMTCTPTPTWQWQWHNRFKPSPVLTNINSWFQVRVRVYLLHC